MLKKGTLYSHLFKWLFLLAFSLLFLGLGFRIYNIINVIKSDIIHEHKNVARLVSLQLKTSYLAGTWPFEILHNLLEFEDVEFWHVVDHKGNIKLSSDTSLWNTQLDGFVPGSTPEIQIENIILPENGGKGLLLKSPIDMEGREQFWSLDIGISLKRLNRARIDVLLNQGIIALITLVLLVFFIAFISKNLLGPLNKLISGIRKVSSGNFEVSIAPQGPSEIRELISSFNHMRDEIMNTREALVKERDYISEILEHMSESLFLINQSGKIHKCNLAAEEITGYKSVQLMDKNFEDLIDTAEPAADPFAKIYTEKIINVELKIIRQDEVKVPVLFSSVPIYEENKLCNVVCIMNNLYEFNKVREEKEQLYKQLLQSQKMEAIGILAGGIAHDFNNILTSILGDTELLLQETDIADEHKKDLANINKSGKRAADLVKQLLVFSRKEMTEMNHLDLNKIILESGQMINRIIGEDIKVTIELEAESKCNISGNRGNIEQILVNLAVNAKDAMPTGGSFKIISKVCELNDEDIKIHGLDNVSPGQYVKLIVADSGAGVSQELTQKIFDPFFTTKGLGKGTGLGLSVVLGIIYAHKGAISLDSVENKGAVFTMYFPLINSEKIEQISTKKISSGSGEKIFIIEDEISIQKVMEKILTKNNYKCIFASNLKEAQAIYSRDHKSIDLVFCDMVLTDSCGNEVIKKLEETYPVKRVIFSTGYIDEDSAYKKIHDSGFAFLQKPFSVKELLDIIRTTLDEPV